MLKVASTSSRSRLVQRNGVATDEVLSELSFRSGRAEPSETFPRDEFFENGISLSSQWSELMNVSIRAYPDESVIYWSLEDLPANPTLASNL